MYMPFPVLTPRLIDSKWFNADSPCDEETELVALERDQRSDFAAVVHLYSKTALGTFDLEPMEEEAESDDEEGNDESEESEDTHDEEEEEDLGAAYSPTRNNNEIEGYSIAELNL